MLIIGNITIEHIPHIDDTHYNAHEIRYAHMVNNNMLVGPKKQIEYAARDSSLPVPF
jgi:hypothetical protein